MFPAHLAHKEENMRILAGLMMTAALGVTAAAAQPGRLSDVAYIQAARCAGLASSGKLGPADPGALISLLKAQSGGREVYVLEKASSMQDDAKRQANHADGYNKEKLAAELSGACAALKG